MLEAVYIDVVHMQLVEGEALSRVRTTVLASKYWSPRGARHKAVIVYTDGASAGNPGPDGWAYLMEEQLVSGAVAIATNNQMELTAILEAVRASPRSVELHIVGDSKVALGLVCRGWKGHNGQLQAIRDQIHRQAFLKCVRLTCTLVRGHAGSLGNALVDERARLEAPRMRSRLLSRGGL